MEWSYILFEFEGRISRAAFWVGTAIVWGLLVVAGILFARNLPTIFAVVAVLSLWPALAVSIKRWHDRNKSAWWVLIVLIPVFGPLWALIETGFLPGTAGWNKYGEDPLNPEENF